MHTVFTNSSFLYSLKSTLSNINRFETDPLDIKGLTAFIPSHLHPISSASPATLLSGEQLAWLNGGSLPPVLRPRLWAKLPPELQENVKYYKAPLIDLPKTCNRSLPHDWWLQALLDGKILPWLFDLDTDMIKQKDAEPQDWDWEYLVRTLAQVEAFEPGNTMENAPLGLRNRRRIWRILEEIEVPGPGETREEVFEGARFSESGLKQGMKELSERCGSLYCKVNNAL